MPLSLVSYAWLAGPISGVAMQPVVGHASDRLGLRWPFLVSGCAVAVAALVTFAHAGTLGVAVTSFFAMDFAINAVQGPVRTLLTDATAQGDGLAGGNAMMALCASGGNALAGLAGFVDLAWGENGSGFAKAIAGDQVRVDACFTLLLPLNLINSPRALYGRLHTSSIHHHHHHHHHPSVEIPLLLRISCHDHHLCYVYSRSPWHSPSPSRS